jgi:hypothetical protein
MMFCRADSFALIETSGEVDASSAYGHTKENFLIMKFAIYILAMEALVVSSPL